jgi:ABC-type transporter Mla subunit MlaD
MAGVRFPNLTAGLQQLGSQLDGVADKARTTQGVIGEARGVVDGMGSSLAALDAKTEETVARQSKFREEIEQSRSAVDAFDQIQAAVADRGNVWGEELQLQMELVRLGGQSLQEFLTKFGDAQIALEDGMHTIRDLFSGTDFNAYSQQIQSLIDGVRDGGTALGDVFAFLQKNAATLGKGLSEAIAAFQRGEISLQRLADLLQKYKQDFQGTELADLADALLQGVLGGDLT